MRALSALPLLLVTATLAGCLGDDAGSTQDLAEEPAWVVAQAGSASGDVAGFVWDVPELSACDMELTASASADASGAQASAGGASGSAGPSGVQAAVPCIGASASADMDGAQVSARGVDATAGLDGLTLEVVPDTSALTELQDFAFLVFTIQDGVAEHAMTVLSSELERVEGAAGGAQSATMVAAESLPFLVPLEGLGLAPGAQVGFVMVAVDAAAGDALQVAAEAEAGVSGLPVGVPDYGFAFRLAAAAEADAAQAAADLQALANQGRAKLADGAAEAQAEAQAAAAAGQSLLDEVVATGQAKVIATVEQAQGYDLGVFIEVVRGAVEGMADVTFLSDSIQVTTSIEGGLQPFASVEDLTISYDGTFTGGWGLAIGAYTATENGKVDWNVAADVHGQTFDQAGSITGLGDLQQIGEDPAFILEAAGDGVQTTLFELERRAQDGVSLTYVIQMDINADLAVLLGVGEVLPVNVEDLTGGIPLDPAGGGLRLDAPQIGPVLLHGLQ